MEYAKVRTASRPTVGGVSVAGLHESYGKTHLLREVDLETTGVEVVPIIKPSGGGKNTFRGCLSSPNRRSRSGSGLSPAPAPRAS